MLMHGLVPVFVQEERMESKCCSISVHFSTGAVGCHILLYVVCNRVTV